jgi:hypothetical protein
MESTNNNDITKKMNKKLLQLLHCFINDLVVAFEERKNGILSSCDLILKLETIDNIENYNAIKQFLETIYKHNSKITKRDEKLFTDFTIFKDVNMTELWEVSTDQNKQAIWKYLQSFAIISIHFYSSKTVKQLLDGDNDVLDNHNKKDLKDVKNLNELSKSVKEKPKQKVDNNNILGDMSQFLEGSDIGKLAMDIATEINVDEFKNDIDPNTNPMEMLQSGNFMDMFKKINETVSSKISNGEINPETMMSQMMNMMPMMNENPLFKNMMNNENLKNIVNDE